jgi:hypothetical protein
MLSGVKRERLHESQARSERKGFCGRHILAPSDSLPRASVGQRAARPVNPLRAQSLLFLDRGSQSRILPGALWSALGTARGWVARVHGALQLADCAILYRAPLRRFSERKYRSNLATANDARAWGIESHRRPPRLGCSNPRSRPLGLRRTLEGPCHAGGRGELRAQTELADPCGFAGIGDPPLSLDLLRWRLSEDHRVGVRWGEKADLERSRFERCTREVKMKLYSSPSLDNGDRPCPILRPSSCL